MSNPAFAKLPSVGLDALTLDRQAVFHIINKRIDDEIAWRNSYRGAGEMQGAACCNYAAEVLLEIRKAIRSIEQDADVATEEQGKSLQSDLEPPSER